MENDTPRRMPNVPPFVKFVCANVPMVFDDSLSYYEALCALWKYVQSMTDVINNNATLEEEFIEKFNALSDKFDQLKLWVETYFDNLDVQEEINNKLDQMVEDGTLDSIIKPYLTPYVEDIVKLKNNKWGLVGISKDGSGSSVSHILYSPDGEKFFECGTMPAGTGSDASSLIEIEGKFYYFGNGGYTFTEDFVNWATTRTVNPNYNGGMNRKLWGCSAYYDKENSIVYIYGSYQYSDDEVTSAYGGTTYYFKIGYQTATVNEDGTLNIDYTVNDLIYTDTQSFIDPYVAKDPQLGYFIAYKNELTAKIVIQSMSSLTSADGVAHTNPIQGLEAPQLVSTPFGLLCYVDGYALHNKTDTDIQNLPSVSAYFPVTYKGSLYDVTQMGLCPIYAPITLRHLGVMPCSKNAFYCMQQFGITTQIPTSSSRYDYMNGVMNISLTSSTNPKLVNFPYALYTATANKTVTIKTAFKEIPLRIYIRKGVSLTWGSDSTIQSSCKNQTYTAPHDEILTLYPDGRDSQSGMWVPINRA